MKRLIVTLGDPAGVGPELTARALSALPRGLAAVVVGPAEIAAEAMRRFASPGLARRFRLAPAVRDWRLAVDLRAPLLRLDAGDYPLARLVPGTSDAAEGRAAWAALESALELTLAAPGQALVTAPASKASLLAAGFRHPGHTDFLAERTGCRAVMMLAAGAFRVVPVTAHIPLAAVPAALGVDLIRETIEIVARELREKFRIAAPRLAVAGLNPHAGEGGALGDEERRLIAPAIAAAREAGIAVEGPFPADTMFTKKMRRRYDAAVCMYHDQALIPLKTIGFRRGVNVTLGLPLVRTSPAHGTAFDLAWTGKADPASTIAALELAASLITT